jgi:hypothetical protein
LQDTGARGTWRRPPTRARPDRAQRGKVDGIKISLLDQAHEEAFRARLPEGVRLYTGDDFNYAPLIEGDGTHYSHALLGIFAAIAPAASQALEALAKGDSATYHALLRRRFRSAVRSSRRRRGSTRRVSRSCHG